MEKLIEVTNLSYQDRLNNITMSIEKNQFISISGTNKCGKTTLIKVLGQFIDVKDSVKYSDLFSHEQITSKQISLIFNDNLTSFTKATVIEELSWMLNEWDSKKESSKKRLKEVLEECDLVEVQKDKIDMLCPYDYMNFLLARAICFNPVLLLLDNSIHSLNKEEKTLFLEKLNKWKEKNQSTIIMTTNCLEDTLDTDYLYIMNRGKIILEGEPLSVLKEERILTRLGLELPFMVDLSLKLQFYNVLNEMILDEKKMVDVLWK